MKIQEPNVEFVELDQTEMRTESSPGQETHMCSGFGTQFLPDEQTCSTDPSYF